MWIRWHSMTGALGILVSLAVLAGCAPTSQPRQDLPLAVDPARRLELPGLSVLPPRGENWFIAPRVSGVPGVPAVNLAAYAKRPPPEAPDRVVYARVNVWDLGPWRLDSQDAFLRFVREDLERGTPRQRVLALELGPASSPAPTCARYRRTAELRGAPGFPDATFVLTTAGVWCLHPHWPRYGIDLVYGQRYRQGLEPLPVEADVEPFLRGVVFTREQPTAGPYPTPDTRRFWLPR